MIADPPQAQTQHCLQCERLQRELDTARSDLFAAKKLLADGIAVYDKTFSQRHEWKCRVVKAFPVVEGK